MYPKIIQGGMGVNISSWPLARAVSMLGQQGTLSGVALEIIMARLLQRGDKGGHLRRALLNFPFQNVSKKVLDTFFVEGGIPKGASFKRVPVLSVMPSDLLISMIVCANFAFVWLAKEGHKNPVSINYLEKIAVPHIYAITGAMLANVDFITMGAGMGLHIPDVIDDIMGGRPTSYNLPIVGERITEYVLHFCPEQFFGGKLPSMKKPGFIPVISSYVAARGFTRRKPEAGIYGFAIETSTAQNGSIAGGHNARPRKLIFNDLHEPLPIYGPKDETEIKEIIDLGLPCWIGGGYASPEKLKWALEAGAKGIQAGSIFGLCEQSGMDPELRRRICKLGFTGKLTVRTDMLISSTGFPFKVAIIDGTLSEKNVYDHRIRTCNHGVLVSLYEMEDGSIGYRCPGEPINNFIAKGGDVKDVAGRGCLCNGLISTAGLNDHGEPSIVTLGDDISFLPKVMADADSPYSAEDAINYILGYKS